MKRLLLTISLICSLTLVNAQFFRGLGIFVGANSTAHRYRNLGASQKDPLNPVFTQYYPQNHYSHDYFSYAVGIFAEFLRYDHIRWQTEIEFTNKGAIEKEVDWYTGQRTGVVGANVYQYLQWNNYLKFMGNTTSRGQWYTMLGVKIEYNLARSTPIFVPVSSTFPKLWWSGDAGIGFEFFTWKRIHPFIEFHYNPDLMYQPPRAGSSVRSRTFELRIGLIYRPSKRSIDDCNAPTYHGNYY